MKYLLVIVLLITIAGCSYMYPTAESRIAKYQERCALIGFAQGTKENALCVLELEKSYVQGAAQKSSSSSSGGMSFLCKDAISRGDSGAINVHCN
jgi:hypothetical protein